MCDDQIKVNNLSIYELFLFFTVKMIMGLLVLIMITVCILITMIEIVDYNDGLKNDHTC